MANVDTEHFVVRAPLDSYDEARIRAVLEKCTVVLLYYNIAHLAHLNLVLNLLPSA